MKVKKEKENKRERNFLKNQLMKELKSKTILNIREMKRATCNLDRLSMVAQLNKVGYQGLFIHSWWIKSSNLGLLLIAYYDFQAT